MEWSTLAAAIVTGTAIHAAMEPINIIDKLHRLDTATQTGEVVEPKVKGIDSRAKAFVAGLAAIAISSIAAYFILRLFDMSTEATFKYIAVVAVVSELVLGAGVDRYHVLIEKITRKHSS